VAQLEHNAMQALALVRAAHNALAEVARVADRAALLLSHSRGLVEAAVKPELQRVFAAIVGQVQAAAVNGEPLLQGGAQAFALDDPWQPASEPLCVELPDLRLAADALAAVDLSGGANALTVSQRNTVLLGEVRLAQKQLTATAKRLVEQLGKQRRDGDGAPLPSARRAQDEGFVSMIGRVRDHVLHAGDAALRVQGPPTTRAAWLVERRESSG
jgi:hypothetical protein